MSDDTPKESRRLYQRRQPRQTIKATCRKGNLGEVLAQAIVNVSETGVCLVLRADLPKGQEVSLTLASRQHRFQLRLLGTVAWCQQVGIYWVTGIHFQKRILDADFLNLIQGPTTSA